MSQDYKLLQFKPSDFQDQHGNTWCDVAFEGISEPVKWVVKDPARVEVGKSYFGRIEQKTSKANKPYQRFYAEKKEEAPKSEQTDEYWQERNDTIRAQWAIGQAVQATELKADANGYDIDVLDLAGRFFNMVDRVKVSGQNTPIEKPTVIEDEEEVINLDDIPF